MNPQAPSFKGLPKLHKEGLPIRPLVNFISAPSYKLTKKLDKLPRQHLTVGNSHSFKNSTEFVDNTKQLQVENHMLMALFDIVNLFTNVPVHVTLDIIKQNFH